MPSKTKCIYCGSRKIETKITWTQFLDSKRKTIREIFKRCLDCDKTLVQPWRLEYYE